MPYIALSKNDEDYLNTLTNLQPTTTLKENFDASIEDFWRNSMSISKGYYVSKYSTDLYEQNLENAKRLGSDLPELSTLDKTDWQQQELINGIVNEYNVKVGELKKSNPHMNFYSTDEIEQRARDRAIMEAKAAKAEHKDISDRASGWGVVGDIAGSAAGAMSDPVNIVVTIATLPIALESWGAAILGNALIGAASETAVQATGVNAWKQETGQTSTQAFHESTTDVASAALGAGVFGGVFKGVGVVGRKLLSTNPLEAREAAKVLSENTDKLTPEQRDLLTVIRTAYGLEDDVSVGIKATKPFTEMDAEQLAKNIQMYESAMNSLRNGRLEENLRVNANDTLAAMQKRSELINSTIEQLRNKELSAEQVDVMLQSILTEKQYANYLDLVDKYSAKPLSDNVGKIKQAERQIGYAEARTSKDATPVQELSAKVDILTNDVKHLETQIKQPMPDINTISRLPISEDTINVLKDMERKLANKSLSEKKRVALQQQYEGMVETVKREIQTNLSTLLEKQKAELEKVSSELASADKKFVTADDNLAKQNATKDVLQEKATLGNPMLDAARETLIDARLSEQDKILYAHLVNDNPTIKPETIRYLATLAELDERIKAGDIVTADNVRAVLPNEKQVAQFNEVLAKANNDVATAIDKFFTTKKNINLKEGREILQHIKGNIDKIQKEFSDQPLLKRLLDNNEIQTVNIKEYKQEVADLADGKIITHEQNMRSLENTKEFTFNDDEGNILKVSDVIKEAEDMDKMATILEACKL